MKEAKWLLKVSHATKKPILLLVSSREAPFELAKTLAADLRSTCEIFAVGDIIERFEPTNGEWLERDGT